METKKDLPNRRPLRLRHYDYSRAGAYFITICTAHRANILSEILPAQTVGGGVLDAPQVKLSAYGKIAEMQLCRMNDFYSHIAIKHYIIMPNHIHMLIEIYGSSRTPTPTVEAKDATTTHETDMAQNSIIAQFVSTFKRFCNKEYGRNIWQRSYYDHIIRDKEDYDACVTYIHENPLHWSQDEHYTND